MRVFSGVFCAVVALLAAGPAWSAVTVTFYAHPGARVRGATLLFPHAYVHATGYLDDTGEPVDWAVGFTARGASPALLFGPGVGMVTHPEARYVGEGRAYLRLRVSDDVYRALWARAEWWNSPQGRRYELRRRNCITFVADLARTAGLRTAAEPSMKPGTFLEATAALNPRAAWRSDARPVMIATRPLGPLPTLSQASPPGRG